MMMKNFSTMNDMMTSDAEFLPMSQAASMTSRDESTYKPNYILLRNPNEKPPPPLFPDVTIYGSNVFFVLSAL